MPDEAQKQQEVIQAFPERVVELAKKSGKVDESVVEEIGKKVQELAEHNQQAKEKVIALSDQHLLNLLDEAIRQAEQIAYSPPYTSGGETTTDDAEKIDSPEEARAVVTHLVDAIVLKRWEIGLKFKHKQTPEDAAYSAAIVKEAGDKIHQHLDQEVPDWVPLNIRAEYGLMIINYLFKQTFAGMDVGSLILEKQIAQVVEEELHNANTPFVTLEKWLSSDDQLYGGANYKKAYDLAQQDKDKKKDRVEQKRQPAKTTEPTPAVSPTGAPQPTPAATPDLKLPATAEALITQISTWEKQLNSLYYPDKLPREVTDSLVTLKAASGTPDTMTDEQKQEYAQLQTRADNYKKFEAAEAHSRRLKKKLAEQTMALNPETDSDKITQVKDMMKQLEQLDLKKEIGQEGNSSNFDSLKTQAEALLPAQATSEGKKADKWLEKILNTRDASSTLGGLLFMLKDLLINTGLLDLLHSFNVVSDATLEKAGFERVGGMLERNPRLQARKRIEQSKLAIPSGTWDLTVALGDQSKKLQDLTPGEFIKIKFAEQANFENSGGKLDNIGTSLLKIEDENPLAFNHLDILYFIRNKMNTGRFNDEDLNNLFKPADKTGDEN